MMTLPKTKSISTRDLDRNKDIKHFNKTAKSTAKKALRKAFFFAPHYEELTDYDHVSLRAKERYGKDTQVILTEEYSITIETTVYVKPR